MSLRDFIISLNQQLDVPIPTDWATSTDEIGIAQKALERLNEYFFQTYDGIGTTILNGKDYQYFSEFHKYWESHHATIINAEIDREQAAIMARNLHEAQMTYGTDIFNVTHNTRGLSSQAIAQVRFFTANQDFRVPPEDQYGKYLEDDRQFSAESISSDPLDFLKHLGNSKLSQNDKRLDFARHAADFLLARGIKAYQIAEYFNYDASQIRNGILENVGMGYGRKKTDMFIRDMFVLNVWPQLSNMGVIDVASDRNTMKLALRSRILKTEMPLLSSFLDIFGYQYAYIDEISAAAWRAVWEEWVQRYPTTAPVAPCMMDFLLYRIGREYCDDDLVEFVCENGHRFFYFGARLKRCRECRAQLSVVRRFLPCQVMSTQLPRDSEGLLLGPSELLRTFDGVCIFESACRPKNADFRKLSPPKSISIVGRTGWTDSYANRKEGGGGMMG